VELACFAISCGVEKVDFTEPEGRPVEQGKSGRRLSPETAGG
jgi:hypothetical protein